MQTRIASTTNKLGFCALWLVALMLMAAMSPLYVTIICGQQGDGNVVAGAGGDSALSLSSSSSSHLNVVDRPVPAEQVVENHQPPTLHQQEHENADASPQRDDRTGDTSSNRTERILSRRRRYLVFPKDSSVQLVFDQIISIVDFTLYVVTGQTVALAWELPHQPLSIEDLFPNPLNDHFADEPEDEPIVAASPAAAQQPLVHLQQHQQQQLQYQQQLQQYHQAVNMLRPFFQPQHQQHQTPAHFNSPFIPLRRKDSFYFSNRTSPAETTSALQRWWQQDRQHTPNHNYPVSTTITTTTTQKPPPRDPNKAHEIIITDNFPFNSRRPILPIGKRSTESAAERHHRSTRYDLYRLMETFLTTIGHNGTACILKTLCEVGVQRQNVQPVGSFLAEILRVIFRLPDHPAAHAGMRSSPESDTFVYHDAHHQHRQDSIGPATCGERFPACIHSIWTAAIYLK